MALLHINTAIWQVFELVENRTVWWEIGLFWRNFHHREDSDDGVHTTKIIGSSSGSGGNPVTYKLISPAGSGSNTATVLTQPLSGQFYVIGNPSEVQASNSGSSGGAGRVIAPKATLTLANNSPPSSLRCVLINKSVLWYNF